MSESKKTALYLVTTERCDLSCSMCWFANNIDRNVPNEMDLELFEQIIQQAFLLSV